MHTSPASVPVPVPVRIPLFVWALAGTLAAQQPGTPEVIGSIPPFSGVFVDTPDEAGATWARGPAWKARFSTGGVHFVPIFGSAAPRSFAIRLRLARASCGAVDLTLRSDPVLARSGERRIALDHGPLVERFDLAADGVEQSFDLPSPPATGGDLVLRLALDSDLPARRDGAHLVFDAAGLGRVEYRDAVVFDAVGRRLPLSIDLRGQAIELRVPEAFLDRAVFPITVDPLLQAVAVANNALDHADPDVTYSAAADVWLVVCAEMVSATDGDVRCDRFRGDGTFLDTTFADSSTTNTVDPAIADNVAAGRCLVAWTQPNAVRGRTRDPASTAQEASVGLVGSATESFLAPALGGDASPGGNRWLLLYQRGSVLEYAALTFSAGRPAAVGNATPLDGGIGGFSVTRDCRGGDWIAVWSRGLAEIVFAEIDCATAALQLVRAIARLGNDDRPAVAGFSGSRWVVVWQGDGAGSQDIFGCILQRVAGAIVAGTPVNLTSVEPGASAVADQTDPAIGFDGCRFTYVYAEGTKAAVRAATVRVLGGGFVFDEGHVAVGGATASTPAIASKAEAGGAPTDYLACWRQQAIVGPTTGDIEAALYQGYDPGPQLQTVATACPLLPPSVQVKGATLLGRSFTLTLNGAASLFLLVGLPAPVPATLCPAIGGGVCKLGLASIVATVPGPTVVLSIPCTPSLVGGQVAFQCVDVGRPGVGCPKTQFGVDLNISDTAVVTVR